MLGIILVLVSAISFAALPILAVIAYGGGATLITLLFIRFAVAAVVLLATSAFSRTQCQVTPGQLAWFFVLGGVGYTLQSSFYLSSVKFIPASLAALLFYTYPFFVAAWETALGERTPTLWECAGIALSMLGLYRFLWASPPAAPQPPPAPYAPAPAPAPCSASAAFPLRARMIDPRGVGLALAGAVVYSVYIITSSKSIRRAPPVVSSALISWSASMVFLVAGLSARAISFEMSASAWAAVGAAGVVSTAIPMLTFFAGLARVGPSAASSISLVEPVATAALAAVFLGERMNAEQALSAGAILGGIWLTQAARSWAVKTSKTASAASRCTSNPSGIPR